MGPEFVLFLDNGLLDFLEGYSYEESWPAQITLFKVCRQPARANRRGS